jgi:hypothetical protein
LPSISSTDYSTIPSTTTTTTTTTTMDPSSKTRNAKRDRTLRLLTLVSMIPALALLIPSGVIYGIALPALGLLPMCLSCVVSLMALGSKKDAAYANFIVTGADFVTAALLMFLMVIRYVRLLMG